MRLALLPEQNLLEWQHFPYLHSSSRKYLPFSFAATGPYCTRGEKLLWFEQQFSLQPWLPTAANHDGPCGNQVLRSSRDNTLLGNSLDCFPLGTFLNRRHCISANRGFPNEQLHVFLTSYLEVFVSKLAVFLSLSVMPADYLEKHLVATCGFYMGTTDLGSVSFRATYCRCMKSTTSGRAGCWSFGKGRTFVLYPASEESSINCPCCSAGLNLNQELCWVYLLSMLNQETLLLFSLGNISLSLGSSLLFVEMSVSNSNLEDLGLHRQQQATGWPLYFHLKCLFF